MSLPPVIWAQRTDKVYLTITVPNIVKDSVVVELEPTKLHFKGKDATHEYDWNLEFFGEVDVEKSSYNVAPRQVEFKIIRKEEGPYWDRLQKGTQKLTNLKCDWDKWKDEDEEADDAHLDNFGGGMDFGGMGGGMGGMGGMGDMMGGLGGMMGGDGADSDDEDSDDEGIPGLEADDAPEGAESAGEAAQ